MIEITQEMFDAATQEVARRGGYLNPHFNLDYLDEQTRQIIGFLGEFACQEHLGIDWRDNIRDNYLVADDYDFIFNNQRVDVKTETIPTEHTLNQVINRTISDDVAYGRRLIHQNQFINNVPNYDYILFGCFLRPSNGQWTPVGEYWHPIGSISCTYILENYHAPAQKPFGNGDYPFPCINIRTSELVGF